MELEPRVYTRAELNTLGITDSEMRRALRAGHLSRPGRGWYAPTDADPEAIEAARRGGCVSCVSALRRHGFWVMPGYHRLHVRGSKHQGAKRHDFCRTPGRPLPVTTSLDPPEIALACAAGCMSEEDWIITADSVLNKSQISVDELAARLPQTSRRIVRMLSKCDPGSQSGTESAVRLRLRARGFHVEVQARVPGVGHVDLKVGKLIIECDSKEHHTSRENYHKDRRRDRKSFTQRLIPFRVTYDDVLYGWDEVLADICVITDADRHRLPRTRPSSP